MTGHSVTGMMPALSVPRLSLHHQNRHLLSDYLSFAGDVRPVRVSKQPLDSRFANVFVIDGFYLPFCARDVYSSQRLVVAGSLLAPMCSLLDRTYSKAHGKSCKSR